MTYRIDSDVPVPYGRTILKRTKDESLNVERIVSDKKYLVAVLGSNCAGVNKRWDYIYKLKSLLGMFDFLFYYYYYYYYERKYIKYLFTYLKKIYIYI